MHGRCGVAVLAMAAALACGFWPFRTTTITPLHKTNWSHQEALASSSLPHSVSNWSAWMDTSPETETTSDSASTSSGFPPEAAADSTVTRSATTSDALVTTSVLVTTSKAPVTSSKAPVTSFTGSSIVPASTSHDLAVAVAIVGGARSLLWNAVCKNIKERLVNGLAADGWRVDVFLFLSLRDDARPGRVARNYRPEQPLGAPRSVCSALSGHGWGSLGRPSRRSVGPAIAQHARGLQTCLSRGLPVGRAIDGAVLARNV
ncbi:unnamed protein product [Durusdinium trenchii]|uniref:Uncharacterized protein n=1 Tax=Durusdinium trenchii TaxID=1381693 RepID=A0ABP0MYV0_9DINO